MGALNASMLMGKEQPDSGTIEVGETVQLACVDQSREDLDIDLTQERTLTCSSTRMVVTFTPDRSKC